MKDIFFIGLYWNKRKEELDVCITKIKSTIIFLKEIDKDFNLWYKTSKPRKGESILPIDMSTDELETLLLKGRNYNDIGEIIEDLGYSIMLKSEKDYGRACILSITCGCYVENLPNSITLNIHNNSFHNNLPNAKKIEIIYYKFVEIWKPDKGVIRVENEEILSNIF